MGMSNYVLDEEEAADQARLDAAVLRLGMKIEQFGKTGAITDEAGRKKWLLETYYDWHNNDYVPALFPDEDDRD